MTSVSFRPTKRRRRGSLNVTSLIDVLFLLLIFFMLTSTFRRGGEMKLDLPESTTSTPAPEGKERKPAELVLLADGQVLLNGSQIEGAALEERLRAMVQADPQATVVLNAEAASRHADVVHLLDLVRKAGFAGVSLGTEMRAGILAPREGHG